MAVRKIAISVPEDVLHQVDRLAKKSKTTRSALITRVLKEISRASGEREMINQINSLFKDEQLAHEQRETSEMFLHSPKKKYGSSKW